MSQEKLMRFRALYGDSTTIIPQFIDLIIKNTQNKLDLLKNFMLVENNIEFLKNYNILEKYYAENFNNDVFNEIFPNYSNNLTEFNKIEDAIKNINKEIINDFKKLITNYQNILNIKNNKSLDEIKKEMATFYERLNDALFNQSITDENKNLGDAINSIKNNNKLKIMLESLFTDEILNKAREYTNNLENSKIFNDSISAKFMNALNSNMDKISISTFGELLSTTTETLDCLDLNKPLKCGLNLGKNLFSIFQKQGGKSNKKHKSNKKYKSNKKHKSNKNHKSNKKYKSNKKHKTNKKQRSNN